MGITHKLEILKAMDMKNSANNTFFTLIAATIFSSNCLGQDYKKKFQDLCATKDTAGQISLLKDWEEKAPNDPELFVSYFNYYYQKSQSEVIGLEQTPRSEPSLQITDSKGNGVGYMNSTIQFNNKYSKMGLEYIDKGIANFPNRLDMRFGKIYVLGQTENYRSFTDEIIKTINYSGINKSVWLWTDNKSKKDPEQFMLGAIQDYVVQLYNTNNDALLDNMKQISETVLKYYPDHIESLSNVSIVYAIKKEYDNALIPLLKAEKIAPTDFIVLSNIANVYKQKGDKNNSIKYYELTLKYGDEQAKEFAKGHWRN